MRYKRRALLAAMLTLVVLPAAPAAADEIEDSTSGVGSGPMYAEYRQGTCGDWRNPKQITSGGGDLLVMGGYSYVELGFKSWAICAQLDGPEGATGSGLGVLKTLDRSYRLEISELIHVRGVQATFSGSYEQYDNSGTTPTGVVGMVQGHAQATTPLSLAWFGYAHVVLVPSTGNGDYDGCAERGPVTPVVSQQIGGAEVSVVRQGGVDETNVCVKVSNGDLDLVNHRQEVAADEPPGGGPLPVEVVPFAEEPETPSSPCSQRIYRGEIFLVGGLSVHTSPVGANPTAVCIGADDGSGWYYHMILVHA